MSQIEQQETPTGQDSCAQCNESIPAQGEMAQYGAGLADMGGQGDAGQYQQQGPAPQAPQGPAPAAQQGSACEGRQASSPMAQYGPSPMAQHGPAPQGGGDEGSCGCEQGSPGQPQGGFGGPAPGQPGAFPGNNPQMAPAGGWGAPQQGQPMGGHGQPGMNQAPQPQGQPDRGPGAGHVCGHDHAAPMPGQFPGQMPDAMYGQYPGQAPGAMYGQHPGQAYGPMPGMGPVGHPGFGGMPFNMGQGSFQQGPNFGEIMGVVNDMMNGKTDPTKVAGLLGNLDSGFWKGAAMGAALALLISSPMITDTLSGLFSSKQEKEQKNASKAD